MRDIGEKGDELARFQRPGVDHLTAEPHNGDDGAVDNEHHNGHIHHHGAEGPQGGILQILVPPRELLSLVILPDKGFHHADARQVLLHHQVQRVGLFLEGAEHGPHPGQDDRHRRQQQRQGHQEHVTELIADADGQDQGADKHHRGPDQQPHPHHQ